MAPENFLGAYDETVDQYSFAMIMYGLLCGHEAFADKFMTQYQMADGAAHRGLRPTCNKKWPQQLIDILQVGIRLHSRKREKSGGTSGLSIRDSHGFAN